MSPLIFGSGEQISITLQGKDTTLQEATIAADLVVCNLDLMKSFIRFMRM